MIKEQDIETLKAWKIFILTQSILFWHKLFFWPMPKFGSTPIYGPTPPTPKFYGPTPPMPKFRPTPPTPFFWPTPKFYRSTPPTPSTPKFDPRYPRHPRYLADFRKSDFQWDCRNSRHLVTILICEREKMSNIGWEKLV